MESLTFPILGGVGVFLLAKIWFQSNANSNNSVLTGIDKQLNGSLKKVPDVAIDARPNLTHLVPVKGPTLREGRKSYYRLPNKSYYYVYDDHGMPPKGDLA